MPNITCGWCRHNFNATVTISRKDDCRTLLNCPGCARLLPSSKITSTGNVVGRKHVHREYRDGDVV